MLSPFGPEIFHLTKVEAISEHRHSVPPSTCCRCPRYTHCDNLDGPEKGMHETWARAQLLKFPLSIEEGTPSKTSSPVCKVEVRPSTYFSNVGEVWSIIHKENKDQ